ncbi:mitochondrial mRNA pseudouridine synthase RPUSD3-like [Rhodnius prolixus]|uniref:mitochondrial mRNA pseudouridine synthase RPUSD3-like n=1 Tax=Rhodnius prolixus TaxID=13249 RepID=UPI003D18EE50
MINVKRSIPYAKRFCHIYKQNYVPSSQIAERLIKGVIYNEKGILVLNKPYGISFSQDKPKNEKNDPLEVSLTTIIPFLKKSLGYTDIINIKVPEKYVSGVAIFCTDKSVQENFHKKLLRMRREDQPSDMYRSIVIGNPIKEMTHFQGAIKLENSPLTREKKAVLVSKCTKGERERGVAKKVVITHRTLASNNNASLVEIGTTRNSWHCVRIYLSTFLLTPVLGDNVHGSRVKTIMGQSVLVDKFSPVAGVPQKLSSELLKILKLTSVRDVAIPLHLHLSSVIINCFDRKGTHIEFLAPAPETFTWTCDRLGLT